MRRDPGAGSPQRDGPAAAAAEDCVDEWWRDYAHRVQAYAMRHVDVHAAQEIVSETFLVAWRRHTDVPADPLPWLLVVARNTIRNHLRTTRRALALERRLMTVVAGSRAAAPAADHDVTEREHVVLALSRLSATDREILLLLAWDGLDRTQAAAVAGCRVATFDVRLSRARKRLTSLLDDTGHVRPAPPDSAAPARSGLAVERPTTGGS